MMILAHSLDADQAHQNIDINSLLIRIELIILEITVNSEIFVRVLFSRNFVSAKFRENKTLTKWWNHSVV